LPKSVRDELGDRVENGEPGKKLVKWLNGLDTVQEILEEQFDGHPITEQNLSEWKRGGRLDWLQRQESLSLVGKPAKTPGAAPANPPSPTTDPAPYESTRLDPT
jgi:hypothetical protein